MREAGEGVGPGRPRPLRAQVGARCPEGGQSLPAPPAPPSHPRFIALVDNAYQSVVTPFLLSFTIQCQSPRWTVDSRHSEACLAGSSPYQQSPAQCLGIVGAQ